MKTRFSTLIFALLAMASQTPAYADSEVCRMANGFLDNGIGGTGQMAANKHGSGKGNGGDGIGGTGYAPIRGDGDDGIGGTGHTGGDGIGGTGQQHQEQAGIVYVSGTIYAYGSICVNGIRVTYTDNTPVTNGQTKSNANSLQLGQVVQVIAEKRHGETSVAAHSIKVVYAVEGRVSSFDKGQKTVTVMGEKVHLSGDTKALNFKAGDVVRISGLRDNRGDIVATHISPRESHSQDMVSGIVRKGEDNRIYVGSTPVSGDLKPAIGSQVVAQGQWNGVALDVSKTAPVVDKIPPKAIYVSLEGYGNSQSQTVAGHQVTGVNLPQQARVIVAGAPAAGGAVKASKVQEVPAANTQTRTDNAARPQTKASASSLNSIVPAAGGSGGGSKTKGGDETGDKTSKSEREGKEDADEKSSSSDSDSKTDKTETETSSNEDQGGDTAGSDDTGSDDTSGSDDTGSDDGGDSGGDSAGDDHGGSGVDTTDDIGGGSETETPDVDTPETETPETETPDVPETETPDVETPDVETPEVPDVPETETPDIETPDVETPELPEVETPELPEVETPEKPEKPEDIEKIEIEEPED